MAAGKGISLRVCEEDGIDRTAWPLTRGVALPGGAVHDAQALRLECEDGRAVPIQLRPLSHWRDGSIKWVLIDFQTDLPAEGESIFTLGWNGGGTASVETPICVTESDGRISVCTGTLRFGIGTERFALLDYVERGQRSAEGHFIADQSFLGDAEGDAGHDLGVGACRGTDRHLYGMGGTCSARWRKTNTKRAWKNRAPCGSSCAAAGPTKPMCPCTTTPAIGHCAGLRAYTPMPAIRFCASSTRSYLPERRAK